MPTTTVYVELGVKSAHHLHHLFASAALHHFHHLTHLFKLLQQLIYFLNRTSASLGNPLFSASIQF